MDKHNDYFDLEKYTENIKLEPRILEHLEYTTSLFQEYFDKLSKYDSYSVIYFWIDSLFNELNSSNNIEGLCTPSLILENDLFFDTLQISNNRIHKLHSFVYNGGSEKSSYRQKDVTVEGVVNGMPNVFYYPPKFTDVPKFMNDYIKFYKTKGIQTINSNPFIKASLCQLLFIRIHPYQDGNGRCGRMIQNIKFTEMINNLYGTNLKLCPLNISPRISDYKVQYCEMIDNITFGLYKDTNHEINNYLNFMLNMYDEQLYFLIQKLDKKSSVLESISKKQSLESNDFIKTVDKMNIKRIRQ